MSGPLGLIAERSPGMLAVGGPGEVAGVAERIWPETNCYADLWLTLLRLMELEPASVFGSALAADHHLGQWLFLKPEQEDLRRIHGLEVTELTVWRPVLDHALAALADGDLLTIEVDSWWLPDTRATDYRTHHVKTTIVPLHLDPEAKRCRYVHNTTVADLSGDDFDGVFGPPPGALPPYVEVIRYRPEHRVAGAAAESAARHLARRPEDNPVVDLAESAREAGKWLRGAPPESFHAWTFATLRQCGATAELAADLCRSGSAGLSADAAPHFEEVARLAKAVQFKMSRLTRGRAVDVTEQLDAMVRAQADAVAALGKPYAAVVGAR